MLTIVVLSIGITHVWARGTIFARVRALWPALLDCPLCAGVWLSLLVQLGLVYLPTATVMLGLACVSATGALAVYGLIRAIPVRHPSDEVNVRLRWAETESAHDSLAKNFSDLLAVCRAQADKIDQLRAESKHRGGGVSSRVAGDRYK